MKLVIWSDLHCGKRQYRTDENNYNKFEHIGYRALKAYIDITLKEKPDLIIDAGDTFETANPSVLAMTKYFSAMKRLDSIPTMTILGNHDFNFANRKSNCSAVGMVEHTYFADYDIKTVEIDGILFVMMPYIYDTVDNIKSYLNKCMTYAKESTCSKKILVTHGITDRYSKISFINDPISLSDDLVELFDLVIIGHIHTPYNYIQGKTTVISPGSMIDYQANEDHTGPIILDTDDMSWSKVKVKTPHIIKKSCNESNINKFLKSVGEDIYQISYTGNVDVIDNDLFIAAKNKAVNLIIDVIEHTEEVAETKKSTLTTNIYTWVKDNYPDYEDIFSKARDAIAANT
jgi:DNA repair exonuclease SbcCD nuclease subunit